MDLNELTEQLQRRVFVELEASGRHVHLTKQQVFSLFGHELTHARPLSQPGQFLAMERVHVIGPKGTLQNVAVLGPAREEAQVELSQTDARMLGMDVPVRLSGHVAQTPSVTLQGPCGTLRLERGVIVAQRHIHMSPKDAALQHVADGAVVKLKTLTARPLIFEQVAVRVSDGFRTYAHLDYDEANACGYRRGDLGMIVP